MPQGAGGRLFEARDSQGNDIVAVKVFRRELPSDAPERQDLIRLFESAQKCEHPGILRYRALAIDDGYLVREWAHGFCLVDLLRKRRELPADELAVLLNEVPDALDSAEKLGLAPAAALISRLFAALDPSVTQEDLQKIKGDPVSQWSDFAVKLNPLSLGRVLPISWDETMHTMSGGVVLAPGESQLPLAFAEGVYELLGAPHRGGRGRRYVPISTLSEGGNTYLRNVLTGQTTPATCTEFWQQFLRESDLHPAPKRRAEAKPKPAPVKTEPAPAPSTAATPPPPPPLRSLRIPDAFLKESRAATILRLTPRDVSFAPIHLFARNSFKIGRSLYHADFITRILPETAENEKLTKEIGRVHVLLERKGSDLTIRDGNGEQGSVNGSRLDGAPLPHDRPAPLTNKAVVSLYRNYELEVIPLLGSYDRGCEITNEADWVGTPEVVPVPINGAVVLHPMNNQPSLRQAAWIFSRLDFSLSSRGDLTWCDAGSPGSQGAFLHHRGHFWIANFQLPAGTLSINRLEIQPNQIVPLVGHQAVAIGPGNYVVEIA